MSHEQPDPTTGTEPGAATGSATRAPGRRSSRSRRRVDATAVLAVVLPAVVVLALLTVRPGDEVDRSTPPDLTALTRSTVVCPSALESEDVSVTSAADGVDGEVRVGLGEQRTPAPVTAGQVTTADGGPDPVAVYGDDATAPGLVAARFGTGAPATASCLPPHPVSWFTGVGAGAGHTSVLELTNPDAGTAVADVLVLGRDGLVDAPRLRGISVPGGSTVEVDLAAELPRRDELSLQVVAARGRIGATVVDQVDPVGSAPPAQDWLPAQPEPTTSNLVLGIAPGAGARRVLVVANGGADEVSASLKVVSDRSVFTPRDVPDLRVPPQSTVRLAVTGQLADLLADGEATGLLVTATEPVTVTLRSQAEGDLSHAVADPVVEDATSTLLLPVVDTTTSTLLLAGASRAGTVEVVSRSADGELLATDRVDVVPGRGASLELPAGAALLSVTPTRTGVSGAVLVVASGPGRGAAVVPLTVPALDGLVPDVRPGLP